LKRYLLDTNICIYFLNGKFNLDKKIKEIGGLKECLISEITMTELKFGAANSKRIKENTKVVKQLADTVTILPIYNCLDIYASEKARLRKAGNPVDEFDLLIGASAVANKLILVTKNTKDFARIKGIKLEDWTIS